MVPMGADPYRAAAPQGVESARYAAQEAELARSIIDDNIRAGGDSMTYPQAVEAARTKLKS